MESITTIKETAWNSKDYKSNVSVGHLALPVIDKAIKLYKKKHGITYKNPLPDGLQVLDIGCGKGASTLEFKKRYPAGKFTGVDYDSDLVKIANENGITTYQGDATKLYDFTTSPYNPTPVDITENKSLSSFPQGGFADITTSTSAIHWMKDAFGAAKSLAAATKKDGILSIEFAQCSPPEVKRAVQRVLERNHYPIVQTAKNIALSDQWRATSKEEWRAYLNTVGFGSIEITPIRRLQPLEGKNGWNEWLQTFAANGLLSFITDTEKKKTILNQVKEELEHLGEKSVAYERLAITAVKGREVDLSKVKNPYALQIKKENWVNTTARPNTQTLTVVK